MNRIHLPSASSANARDLTAAFTQQMFFWGMDAALPAGNLFEKSGFTKTPSPGLKGTSCYSLDWENGRIFLHGACVGYIPLNGDPGLIYIRPANRCFLLHDSSPPVPGVWDRKKLSAISLEDDFHIIRPFLNWWLEHETFVEAEMGTTYRSKCHRKYKSLPKSKPWLTPANGVAWLSLLMKFPADTPRAKNFSSPQNNGS